MATHHNDRARPDRGAQHENLRSLVLRALLHAALCVWGASSATMSTVALAQVQPETVFARVVISETALRSGPNESYRQVGMAQRGDMFAVVERASRLYWLKIERDDGSLAWISGDAVYIESTGRESGHFWPWLFAPSPITRASGELAVIGGVLGSGGVFALRPSVLVQPQFSIEAMLGVSVGSAGRLILLGGGPMINLLPSFPIAPYVCLGGGGIISEPNADTFILGSGSKALFYGGGGLRFPIQGGLTLRIDVRAYAFYDPDVIVTEEELSGGFAVFF